MADSNKTEPSTPKKKRETRDKGEVARSTEISGSVNMFVGMASLFIFSGYFFRIFKNFYTQMSNIMAEAPFTPQGVTDILFMAMMKGMTAILPVLIAILIATLLANYLQVGFKMTGKAIQPKWNKLNPINGVKKIFSTKSWIELAKSIVKIIFMAWIVWGVLKEHLPHTIQLINASLGSNLALLGTVLWNVIWKLGLFLMGVGVLDLIWQRYDFAKNQRMTKQEVRDEFRQTEGDMQIKYKRRAKHRRLTQSRMAAEVARADVVTTNPTHYAVALRYDNRRMRAPELVAKGERLWAKLIVRIARKHQVPVIENKEVTRTLYHNVEIGQEIPPLLYRAVAEVLAALYKLRARRGKRS